MPCLGLALVHHETFLGRGYEGLETTESVDRLLYLLHGVRS